MPFWRAKLARHSPNSAAFAEFRGPSAKARHFGAPDARRRKRPRRLSQRRHARQMPRRNRPGQQTQPAAAPRFSCRVSRAGRNQACPALSRVPAIKQNRLTTVQWKRMHWQNSCKAKSSTYIMASNESALGCWRTAWTQGTVRDYAQSILHLAVAAAVKEAAALALSAPLDASLGRRSLPGVKGEI